MVTEINTEDFLRDIRPATHKIVGLRRRNKNNDLVLIARLWLSDGYVRMRYGDVTYKALEVLGIEPPPAWEQKRYKRLESYVEDLLLAVPAYLYGLTEK